MSARPTRRLRAPRGGSRRAARVAGLTAVLGLVALAAGAGTPGAPSAKLKDGSAGILREVTFDQRLGAQVPLDATLFDEEGREVKLGDFFGEKPVILTLNYFQCPMLCTVELNGLLHSLRSVKPTVGETFEVVTLSFDPRETPELASLKKTQYLKQYGREGAESGWHFLTGPASSIDRISKAVGFHAVYNPDKDQFAHAAGIIVLTPKGTVARYLYGVDYVPRDVRFALAEASEGRVMAPVTRLLLMCYHYDPATGRYNVAIMSIVRLLGVLTVLGVGTFMFVMIRRDGQSSIKAAAADGKAVAAGTPDTESRPEPPSGT